MHITIWSWVTKVSSSPLSLSMLVFAIKKDYFSESALLPEFSRKPLLNCHRTFQDLWTYQMTSSFIERHKLTRIAVSVRLCGNSSTMEQSWTKRNASFQPTSWHSMAMSLVITPDPAKVQVIVNTEPPWSVLEIQLFLGMAQYVVWFILHYTTIVEPLHRLMTKEAKWSWGEEEQAAFQKLKETLTMPMFLHTSVPKKLLRWLLMPVQYVWQGC